MAIEHLSRVALHFEVQMTGTSICPTLGGTELRIPLIETAANTKWNCNQTGVVATSFHEWDRRGPVCSFVCSPDCTSRIGSV